MRRLIPLLAVVLLAGCGEDRGEVSVSTTSTTGTSTTSTTPAATSTATTGDAKEIEVALSEWAIKPASAETEAGSVTFKAANEGQAPHELVLLKTDTKADALKVENAKAKEEGENMGEAEDIEAGGSKDLTVELEAGHYVLICNLPTHYEQGMRADFEVK